MGNESSSVDADEAALLDQHVVDGDIDEAAAEFCGFRVLGIQEQSPAARVGFVSFFDFILSANGIRLDTRDSTFMELIAQSEDQPMQLQVYNIKSQTTRELSLTPSRQWPGKGLLGVTIRFDSYEHAEDQLLHVLEVVRRSPADVAGLKPETDYLLGTPERVFRDPEDLSSEILDALNESFQCYVYNSEEDQVRIVRITPSEKWGGGSVLGAEVGHGVLHRLPSACRETIGSSIGFVSLSDEATAATDPYLRQVRKTDKPQGASEPTTSIAPIAATPEEGIRAQTNEATREASAGALEQESVMVTSEVSPTEAAESAPGSEPTSAALEASATSVPEMSSASAPSVQPGKPRYAARIDPRFPMSTVTVYADPTQLN